MGTTTLQYSIPPTYANEYPKPKKKKREREKTLFTSSTLVDLEKEVNAIERKDIKHCCDNIICS